MIDHLGIGCTDLGAAANFYDRVLGALGHRRLRDFGVAIGFGPAGGQAQFWISGSTTSGNESHLAFAAQDSSQVRAFHDAAIALGAEELHAPRLWPEYHDRYFAAFVRDPEGNNVEVVTHRGE